MLELMDNAFKEDSEQFVCLNDLQEGGSQSETATKRNQLIVWASIGMILYPYHLDPSGSPLPTATSEASNA